MKKILLTVLVAMLACCTVSAQSDSLSFSSTGGRKKVALVLSGGGAKGMAHIGVLKVLERAGIPIDIITGTSMGGIIGGLYAIGYNAHSLDSMVRMQDWNFLITDKEDLRHQSLSDLQKQNTYFFSTGMTIGKRDKNAGGIIRGKNLYELFQKLCVGYTDSLDFTHDLHIPFACVATNIIDNTEVDFHSGRLPQVLRASMSIPAAFSPVRMGDKVLVDGGLRNNYPADIAREMGADIIIGVTLQGDMKEAEELNNTIDIINQIINVNCKNKYFENLDITDLHLRVDTKGYNFASFSPAAIDTLLRRGEELAMLHWDDLMAIKERLGLDSTYHHKIFHPLRPSVMKEKYRVNKYICENMTPQAERFLRQKFHLNKRDSIDAQLEQAITTCMRIDLFYQNAECRLEPEGNGVKVILSAGNRKSVQLHTGVRYDTEEYAAVQLGLDIPLKTPTPINTDITLRLGKRLMARGEVTLHPHSFTRPTFRYTFRRNDVDIYVNGDRDYNILYNQSQTEFIPFNFDLRHFNLQMGLRWDYFHYRNKLGSADAMDMPLKNEHYISYRARATYNGEDNWYFPTRGTRFNAEFAFLTDNFTKLNGKKGLNDVSANWRTSFTIGSRLTLQPMLYGRLLFGNTVPPIFINAIGGDWFGHYLEQQMPFAGIGNMEYVDNQLVAAQLQAQQRIGSNHYVQVRIAGAQLADKLKELLDHRTLFGVQAAYYYNTIFGPAGATFGYSNRTKKVHFYVNLGFVF